MVATKRVICLQINGKSSHDRAQSGKAALSGPQRRLTIERTLAQIDSVGIPPHFEPDTNFYVRLNALSWRTDSSAATEIEARLASFGFDPHSINAEVFAQAREMYLTFENLLIAAQNRRIVLLREIHSFRQKGAGTSAIPRLSPFIR
jgi:hypothetical protein